MITVGGVGSGNYINPATSVTLFSVSGVPGVSTVSESTDILSVSSISIPPSAANPGNSFGLDTGDYRVLDAKWSQGNPYFALNDGCVPSGGSATHSCVRVIEISSASGTPSISQDFDFAQSGYDYFYPALGIDVKGDIDISFSVGFALVDWIFFFPVFIGFRKEMLPNPRVDCDV